MKPFIQITRHLYEEPYTLNLVIIAGNGTAMGSLEFYLNPENLNEIGEALANFPMHDKASYLFERGSEKTEDNFAWFLKFQLSSPGGLQNKFTLRLRFNNNEHLREFHFASDPQLTDFGFVMTGESTRNLGELLTEFSKLNHQRLYWTNETGVLDNGVLEPPTNHGHVVTEAFAALPK